MQKQNISIFWFRRDLRLEDNHGLFEALKSPDPVLPLFIFDTSIINELEIDDARITFIYDQLLTLNTELNRINSCIYCKKGDPFKVWEFLINEFNIKSVFANEDYEPYAIKRDDNILNLLNKNQITLNLYKDQVFFAKNDILKADQKPYTIYTPYKNKWLEKFYTNKIPNYPSETIHNFFKVNFKFPNLSDLGFNRSTLKVLPYNIEDLRDYEKNRNYPALNQTSLLSPHLRFGTISIRKVIQKVINNSTFLNELIWREFFMQILYNYPHVIVGNFNKKYNNIEWRNNLEEFEKWKNGQTGYPIVDAGIRELNATGYMHNRVRMIVASFLCKHLLIDWRWGEAYFAKKLLDFELSSNNGNWQWAAGTGCDAAPYFRVFNPTEQTKKFDTNLLYIKKWVPEFDSLNYPLPMVEHKFARLRAIATYKQGIQNT